MSEKKNVRRFDLGQITNVERTPQGFLKVPGFATRVGVFPYVDAEGKVHAELRHPDDVFAPESLVTLKNAPVTNEHPPEMVTPENYDEYSVGYTTDRVEINRDLVETDLIIAEAVAIEAVEKNGKRELSAGYLADVIEEDGVYNGARYNYRQKNIRYNHVAIVDRGRAGPEVRLRMDSADAEMVTPEEAEMLEKVVISGEEVVLPAHLAAIVRDMMDRYDEMRVKMTNLEEGMKKDTDMKDKKDVDISQKGVDSKVPEVQMVPDGKSAGAKSDAEADEKKKDTDADGDNDGDKKDADEDGKGESPFAKMKKDMDAMKDAYSEQMDAMQAKIDEMSSKSEESPKKSAQGQDDKMDSVKVIVRKRVKLEREAARVVPAELVEKFDSMSDDEVRAAAIKHRHPKADLAGKSSVYLQSRFDSIVEAIEEGTQTRREMGSALLRERMDGEQANPTSARQKMIEATRNLWTSNLSANRK